MYLKSVLHKNLRKAIIKTSKVKINFFYNANGDVNTDADADVSKWSRETTVSYLGTNIQQVKKIEYESYF